MVTTVDRPDAYENLKEGEVLVKEGDTSTDLYWLLEGELVVTKRVEQKGSKNLVMKLGTVKAGELVGEMSFIAQGPRSATVKALTDCKLMKLNYGDFQSMMKGQPKWVTKIVDSLCKRLRDTTDALHRTRGDLEKVTRKE